ncbi:hypothetical protein VN0234_00590 [Helicobacter pylori]
MSNLKNAFWHFLKSIQELSYEEKWFGYKTAQKSHFDQILIYFISFYFIMKLKKFRYNLK